MTTVPYAFGWPGSVVGTLEDTRVDQRTRAELAVGWILEIRSFYDSAKIREVLSPDEQDTLDGSY